MNMQIIFLLVVVCINILIGMGIVLSVVKLEKEIKYDMKLKEKMFLFSLPINDEENFLILDKIILEESQRYQIYNFPSYADDNYIAKKDQEKMLKYILSQTLKKISPVYINKLKYIYNEEVIEDIIFEKVRDTVLNVTVEINGSST